MFELRRERQSYVQVRLNDRKEIERTDVWIDADVLVRDDGFRLVRMGRVRPPIKGICFRYFKDDLQFEFFGDRAHWDGTITDTWSTTLAFNRDQKLGSRVWPLDRHTLEEIAVDIDAALRAWPPQPEEQDVSIGVVHVTFVTFGDYKSEVRLKFGEHPTLRQQEPSTRWQPEMMQHQVRGKERDCESLVRDDGVRLVRIRTMRGPENDGADTYHYVDADVFFDFRAERRLSSLVVTDTWEVTLNPAQRGFCGFSPTLRTQLGQTRAAEIIRNIEEALYSWPPAAEDADIPVNRVVFVGEHSANSS
jgi:hypothetical protein